MNCTLTQNQRTAITNQIHGMRSVARGVGDAESACSIAAINLALTGELTDRVPDCMSRVIGEWIIIIQDAIPAETRNSRRYTELLPLAAGTGRLFEQERLDILLNWMWTAVLPLRQARADRCGHGRSWRNMYEKRTRQAAYSACDDIPRGLPELAIANIAATAATSAAEYASMFGIPAISDRHHDRHHDRSRSQCVAQAAVDCVAVSTDWELLDPCALLEKMILL